jgi:hypothetical protein
MDKISIRFLFLATLLPSFSFAQNNDEVLRDQIFDYVDHNQPIELEKLLLKEKAENGADFVKKLSIFPKKLLIKKWTEEKLSTKTIG